MRPRAPGTPTGCPGTPRGQPLGWRAAGVVYASCFAGVVAVTWPLARHPASLWPPHHDARVFTWIMGSVDRMLVTDPLRLFHGNAFHPNGQSLAYSEPLFVPALLGLWGFLRGDPILTYNVLVLALWPLNGLATAWVAHALTGSRAAAGLAAAVFCLSPYFSEYYLEFQMLLAAFLPVLLFAWARWLETGARGWLVLAVGALVLQGLTAWYYAIIFALALGTLTVAYACLRWRDWGWAGRAWPLGLAAVVGGLVLLPVVLPYLTVRREFEYERSLGESALHSADIFSFVEPPRRNLLYSRWLPAPSKHEPETSAFPGVTALVLAGASLTGLHRTRRTAAAAVWLGRIGQTALVACLLAAGWLLSRGLVRVGVGPVRLHLRPGTLVGLAGLVALGLLLLHGWNAFRARQERTLSPADWIRCLLFLAATFAVLSLGPEIHLAQRRIGPGPYASLYPVLLPLHALRVTTRFTVVWLAGIALLAAFGLRFIEVRLSAWPWLRRAIVAAVFVVLAAEYAVTPAEYERVSAAPRPVDRLLHAVPDDVAVFEWPTNVCVSDADVQFRSLYHGKRVVNGCSGVVPPPLAEISDLLTRPAFPFPGPEAAAALRRIYPLRYLVVRFGDPALPSEWRATWRELRTTAPPFLRFVGSFGREDLYELVSYPERGIYLERAVSYDWLRTRRVLRAAMRPARISEDLDQSVDILLNERLLRQVSLNKMASVQLELVPPFYQVRPNVVAFVHRYERPMASRTAAYAIGSTGVVCPGDLSVESGGGDLAVHVGSVRLNGTELAPGGRGYNLVALNPSGRILAAASFDTFESAAASVELTRWVAVLEPATIVAGAVRDEGSGRLSAAAVEALRSLGVSGDLRGRFRAAHAFIGVKGTPPGAAVEQLAYPRAAVAVGRLNPERGVELLEFAVDIADRVRG